MSFYLARDKLVTLLLNRITQSTRVIHFFSFTGTNEMDKSLIATTAL